MVWPTVHSHASIILLFAPNAARATPQRQTSYNAAWTAVSALMVIIIATLASMTTQAHCVLGLKPLVGLVTIDHIVWFAYCHYEIISGILFWSYCSRKLILCRTFWPRRALAVHCPSLNTVDALTKHALQTISQNTVKQRMGWQ